MRCYILMQQVVKAGTRIKEIPLLPMTSGPVLNEKDRRRLRWCDMNHILRPEACLRIATYSLRVAIRHFTLEAQILPDRMRLERGGDSRSTCYKWFGPLRRVSVTT